MTIIQLLRIYHSFLLKKWYVLLYIALIFVSILSGLIFLSEKMTQDSSSLKIAVVDEDKSKETKLILATVGDGKDMGEQLNISAQTKEDAQQLLKNHQLDGYFVFEKGMTEQFYKYGELPIQVHAYDENSVQSIVINELADMVYSRLMLSEAGILSYAKLNKEATDDELVKVMIDLLFVGLDREAAFDVQEVASYETYKYIVISAFFLLIYLFYSSLSMLLQMNQSVALKKRLTLYPFVREKLILSRAIFALCYTTLFMVIMACIIYPFTALESYNIPYFLVILAYYLLAIFLASILCELLAQPFLKIILTILIILLSGATIPLLYLKQSIIFQQFFSQIFNALMELLHHNYIVDWSVLFYVQFAGLLFISLLVLFFLWRRGR